MNRRTKLVLELLKTKASALGFNKEELEGAASQIAGNLAVNDDASEEELNAAIEKAVAVYLPFLELSQKNANRIIQKNKEEREKAEAEAKRKAEEEAARKAAEEAEAARRAEEEAAAKKAEDERKAAEEAAKKAAEEAGFKKLLDSEWAKGLRAENEKLAKRIKEQDNLIKEEREAAKKRMEKFEEFQREFETMRAERLRLNRESRLNEIVKDAGVFGKRIRENYTKMSFESDEDFDKFLSDIKEDINEFNQERADKGLALLGTPASGETEPPGGKAEPMSDAEVDALASIM